MRVSRLLIWFIFLMTLAFACDTASNVDPIYKDYFIKTFGSDGDQEGVDVVVNADNTITILGKSIHVDGAVRIYFIKTDLRGKILLEKELGGSNESPKDIEPLTNGYIILSNVFVDQTRNDIKLLRTDLDGVVIDSVVFAGLADQFGNTVTPLSDGRFYVAGNTRDTDEVENSDLGIEDQEDLLILEFDNSFNVLDTSRIGRSSKGMCVKLYDNGSSYTYAGYSDEIRVGVDTNTNFIFRTFISDPRSVSTLYVGNDTDQEKMSSLVRMPDGGYFGIGTQTSSSGSEIFISKVINSLGQPISLFSKRYGNGFTNGVTGYPSSSGIFIFVLANQFNDVDGTSNIILLKVNTINKEEVWSRKIGSIGYNERSNALAELPNGDIIIVGTVNLINQNKVTLIKLNSNGEF